MQKHISHSKYNNAIMCDDPTVPDIGSPYDIEVLQRIHLSSQKDKNKLRYDIQNEENEIKYPEKFKFRYNL